MLKKISPSLLSVTVFFLLWEIVGRYIGMLFILPWPTAILKKIWILKEPLFLTHLPVTLLTALVSIFFSLILGGSLAVLMDFNKKIEEAIFPIIVTTQTIPTTALAPIFILWFGYSIWSKVIVAVLITFFPVTITIFQGLKGVEKDQIDLFKSFNASKKDIFLKLKVPTAIPSFFSALKISIPLVLIGAAIGEWLGATAGLGYFSKRMMSQLDGAGVFAPIVIISLLAIVLVEIITSLEKYILRWRIK